MQNQTTVQVEATIQVRQVKKLLVLPAALDKNHPLFVGFVPRDK